MAAKVKKTTKKAAKKADKKVAKKSATAAKAAPKAVKKSKASAKAKTTSKKTTSAKKSSSKVAKKTTAKKVAKKTTKEKSKKGLLNKIVGKLTSKKTAVDKAPKTAAPSKASKAKAPKAKKAVIKEELVIKKTEVVEDVTTKTAPKNIAELTQEFTEKKITAEVLLTDAEGRVLCKFSGCDEIATVEGYCRYHYLLNWKRIQLKKKILSEGKLEKYINELTAKYPDKYIEMLKNDLKSEKDFLSVVNELEIDDSDNGMSDDEEDNYIEQEVQGVSGSKRSSEDDY